jgi:hypothetical protein
MNEKRAYTYTVLRYVHDVVSGEFVNVGIVLYFADQGVLKQKTRTTIGRIRCAFPDVSRDAFTSAIRTVRRGIGAVAKRQFNEALFRRDGDARTFASMVIPHDDSSFQWSPCSSGVSNDPDKTLERLYARLVTRYDRPSHHTGRSDDDIWRPIRDKLAQRHVPIDLGPKTISGATDEIEFRHAWKNGQWHAYEPVSLDLADADGIKDKARRWRGHLAAVGDGAQENLMLHFIVGAPSDTALMPAYKSAVEILRGSAFSPDIYEEGDVDTLVERIEDKARAHAARDSERSHR